MATSMTQKVRDVVLAKHRVSEKVLFLPMCLDLESAMYSNQANHKKDVASTFCQKEFQDKLSFVLQKWSLPEFRTEIAEHRGWSIGAH